MTSAQVDSSEQSSEASEEGYERGLGSRQVQMIAIGGAIGVGLFLGAGAATAAGIWTWLMILISHVLYRRAVDAGRLPASAFPAPGGAVCSWIAIVFLLFVNGLIAYDGDSRVCLYVMAGWAAALGIGWLVLKNRNPQTGGRDEPVLSKTG